MLNIILPALLKWMIRFSDQEVIRQAEELSEKVQFCVLYLFIETATVLSSILYEFC